MLVTVKWRWLIDQGRRWKPGASRDAVDTQIHGNSMTGNAAETKTITGKKSGGFPLSDRTKDMLPYCKPWALDDDHEDDAIATERRHYIYMDGPDYGRSIVPGCIV